MNFVFPHSGSVEISFGVGVAGTSNEPSVVRLTLSRLTTALSFTARKTETAWVATVENVGAIFGDGEVDLSIDVVVNGRIFSPYRSKAVIEAPVKKEEPAPEITINFHTTEEPKVEPKLESVDAIKSLMQTIDSLTHK